MTSPVQRYACPRSTCPIPGDLPGPTTFVFPSLSSSSGNKGKSSGCHHKPAMMNKRRRETEQCNWNIFWTNCEIENTAVHVVRYESLAHWTEKPGLCNHSLFVQTRSPCHRENKLQHWTSSGTKNSRAKWEQQASALDEEHQARLMLDIYHNGRNRNHSDTNSSSELHVFDMAEHVRK